MIFVQSQATGMFWNGNAFAASISDAIPVTNQIAAFLAWMHNASVVRMTVDG